MYRPLRKKGAIMAHSGRGAPKHLGPAADMSRHSQCLYKARGTAGVMQSLWSHQETAGENSGTWRRPEAGGAGAAVGSCVPTEERISVGSSKMGCEVEHMVQEDGVFCDRNLVE